MKCRLQKRAARHTADHPSMRRRDGRELVGDAIKLRHEAYYTSDLYVDHTFEESKAYHTAAEGWGIFLAQMRMTEEEYKEYRDKIRNSAM